MSAYVSPQKGSNVSVTSEGDDITLVATQNGERLVHDLSAKELLYMILQQLKVVSAHLLSITDEEISEDDVD